MPKPGTAFASVKLPSALVTQAREAAQPMRRSVAGQVEYWATLGRIVEHSGLTTQEAQTTIANYEAAARRARSGSQQPQQSPPPLRLIWGKPSPFSTCWRAPFQIPQSL